MLKDECFGFVPAKGERYKPHCKALKVFYDDGVDCGTCPFYKNAEQYRKELEEFDGIKYSCSGAEK